MTTPFTITPARYSKGQFIVRCPSDTGYKTRAARLIHDGLNCRYTGREAGYVASATKVRKFERLYAEGWDANVISDSLIAPTVEG